MKPNALATIAGQRAVSPLSASQWLALEAKAKAAEDALSDLSHSLAMLASDVQGDEPTALALLTEGKRVQDAKSAFLGAYFYHAQPEWLGGDSQDLKNHVLREPALLGMSRRAVLG